jgi:hypothetical protein
MVTRKGCLHFACIILGFLTIPGRADAGDFKVFTRIGCFSVDGVPVPLNTDFYNRCCNQVSPEDPVCTAGFFNISVTSLDDSEAQIDGAYNLIKQNQVLNQASLDLTNNEGQEEPGSETSSLSSDSITSALVSGGDKPNPKSVSEKGSALGGTGNSFSGGQSNSLGGSSTGFGDSSWARKRKKKSATAGTESADFTSGKYASLASGPSMVPGSNGPSSVTSSSQGIEVVEYNTAPTESMNGANSPGGVAAESGQTGGTATAGEGAAQGMSGDSTVMNSGSSADAVDYLKRIHIKDSIFKIVSRRYQREEILKNLAVIRPK